VRGVVELAREAGTSINADTGETVDAAEQSSRRILTHAFQLAVAFVCITLAASLTYRVMLTRWARGAPRAVNRPQGDPAGQMHEAPAR
jgi:hypothetical protein